jgi:molybdopterin converting factor small subunit
MGWVNIKIYTWLSEGFPGRTLTSVALREPFKEGESLRDLFNHLSSTYPRFGEVIFDRQAQHLYPHVNYIYRGKAADPWKDLERKVEDGDEIAFIPIYAGG